MKGKKTNNEELIEIDGKKWCKSTIKEVLKAHTDQLTNKSYNRKLNIGNETVTKCHALKMVKAWAVLDVSGRIKHPSVSIFDTYKEAKGEADALNRLPAPTNVKDPTNYVVKCEIYY